MFSILSLFFTFVAGQALYLLLHLEGSSFPKPLTPREEAAAFEELAGGSNAARERLIYHNLRLVAHVSKKYYANRQEPDDLISIGTIGLIKAVDSFDPKKNIRFATYAAKCVENELLMNFRTAKKEKGTLYISDPIETDREGNNLTLNDIVADGELIEEAFENTEEKEMLRSVVNKVLNGRERQIVLLRYGFMGGAPLTQQQVAGVLNISRSYVSRLEKKAVETLRQTLEQNMATFH